MTLLSFANIALAAVLGSLVGLERQWRQGMAGLRTNALVAFGAACFMTAGNGGDRVAAQIVSGIGFLGAGVIFREGASVRGLNTAATLWCSAAAGTLCGAARHVEAVICAAGIIAINYGLRGLHNAIIHRLPHPVDVETDYLIEIMCEGAEEVNIRALLSNSTMHTGLGLKSLHSEKLDPVAGTVRVAAEMIAHARLDAALEDIVGRLGLEKGVSSACWSVAAPHASGPVDA